MTKQFLVLGSAGFIGSHLCDALLSAGHTVRAFDRPHVPAYRAFAHTEPIEWIQGDFTSATDIERAVAGCDVVYHLVSTTLPKTSNEDVIYDLESNVVGTLRLLEAARKAQVSKVVFVSSGGTVYGVPQQVPIPETHPTEPLSSYGIGKLAIEKYLHLFEVLHGMNHCVLRLANPFGERQRPLAAQGAVAVFLYRALHQQDIEIWGDGSVVRDYLYIADVVQALLKAAAYQGHEKIFNIGSGRGKNLNHIMDAIAALIGRPVARRYLPARAFDVPANVLDISKAAVHLEWQPQTSFEAGLARTLRAMTGSD